jgi:hypothetical protein
MSIERLKLLFAAAFFRRLKRFTSNLSETSVFIIWISLIIFFGVLIWGLTTGMRNDLTIKTVNKFLAGIGESRRIETAVSTWRVPGNITQLGTWYTMSSMETAVIFPLIIEGIFSPCLAIVNNEGKLSTLVPLTVNADRIMPRINPGYLHIWMDRIEKNAAVLNRVQDEKYMRGKQAGETAGGEAG